VKIAGIEVAAPDVRNLAIELRYAGHPRTADLLEDAAAHDKLRVGLTISERAAILTVLDDPAPGLTQLRAVLLEEHVLRKQTGL
jgi:hypothetical protein